MTAACVERHHRVSMCPCASLLLLALSLSGCSIPTDSSRSIQQRAGENRQAARDMRASMRQSPRGEDLADDVLRMAVQGMTFVQRYEVLPGGTPGKHVTYDYFRDDGVLIAIDNFLQLEPNAEDRWRVDGARLCKLDHALSNNWLCYRVARAQDNSLQFYIDDPGSEFHTLLTQVVSERIAGPPPAMN